MIGRTLAHFKVTAKLGEGGMGEVYLAEDTKLGREVALKVLPTSFAADGDRMTRFGREAQVLASLNHPNIAGIHQLEHVEDVHFLVMELVDGETLAERIERGPIPPEEALPIAHQIAEAIEAADDRGIVHRDLKPANVKISSKGVVKVLDFGLARAMDGDPDNPASNPAFTHSPTLTAQVTSVGALMGTAGYMSPEQARGETADRRADIWAFGVVLMEMLSGNTVYAGRTLSDTLASVLARDPDWHKLPETTPRPIRRLIERCLEKDLRRRLQAIGEARLVIEEYLADPDAAESEDAGKATETTGWRRVLPWAALAVAAGAVALAILGWLRPAPEVEPPALRLSVEVASEQPLLTAIGSSVVLSPDGRRMAYATGDTASRGLFVREFDRLQAELVSGSDLAYLPFFSPDGDWVGFVTPTELKKVSVSGGTPLTIASVNFCRGASWGPDGMIVLSPGEDKPLYRVPASGGELEELTTLDEEKGEHTHRWPEVLPAGNAVLFVSHTRNGQFNDGVIEVLDLASRERKVLVRGGSYPRYADSGHLMYAREGTLYAVPFDAKRLELLGTPGPVVEDVITNEASFGSAQYSVSRDGRLVYLTGTASLAGFSLVRVTHDGSITPITDEQARYRTPRFSPDGTKLAMGLASLGDGDLWVHDLERDIRTRLTFDENDDAMPIWSPDGQWILFQSDREDKFALYLVASDGSGQPERISSRENPLFPSDWSPDGKLLAYSEIDPKTSWDIWTMPADGEGEPEVFLQTPAVEYGANFSPDMRWIAYGSNESGQWQVYVRPYPPARGEWMISGDSGGHPVWSPDGSKIYYRNERGVSMVEVDTSSGTFEASRPKVLFEGPFVNQFPMPDFHITPDDGSFAMFQATEMEDANDHVVLVTDWFEQLDRAFAAPRR